MMMYKHVDCESMDVLGYIDVHSRLYVLQHAVQEGHDLAMRQQILNIGLVPPETRHQLPFEP